MAPAVRDSIRLATCWRVPLKDQEEQNWMVTTPGSSTGSTASATVARERRTAENAVVFIF